ncbi:hypothetical protein D3C85_1338410 [compost metagenome]
MGAFAVEAGRVAGLGRVLHLQQFAGVVEGPAVEGAGVGRAVTALVSAKHRTAMAAGIEEGIEHPILVARDEDRLAPHGGGEEVVLFRNLAFVGKVQPVALEDVFHFKIEQTGVGEHLALAAKDALLLIFFKQGIKVIESQGHGRGLRCYCGQAMSG